MGGSGCFCSSVLVWGKKEKIQSRKSAPGRGHPTLPIASAVVLG